MSQYIVEVTLMTPHGRDWLSKGFHQRGHGLPNDRFVIAGRQFAFKMSLEAARRRCELYRERGHRARILDSTDSIVLDFDQPLVEPQKFNRDNSHRWWTYRSLLFVENRVTGQFFHKFKWPFEDGEERSVSGGSPQEIIDRMFGMGGDIPAYLAAHLDKVEPTAEVPAAPQTPSLPPIKLDPDQEILGIRPGSVRF